MKIVDHFTGKLVIGAYDESNEDGVYGEPGCDYAVFPANEYLLKAIREIKDVHSKLNGHFGSNFNKANVNSLEFLFDNQVGFFGKNPDKKGSELFNSILDRGISCYYPVDGFEEDEFDSIDEYRDGAGFNKDHVKLTGDADRPVIVYSPGWSTLYFRQYNPDFYIDYRSYGINIDELIGYLEKNLEK